MSRTHHMSSRTSRKRGRAQRVAAVQEQINLSGADSDGDIAEDPREKEHTVWNAFKDDHFEVFELSSSLKRTFTLVQERDELDEKSSADLAGQINEYFRIRRGRERMANSVATTDDSEESNYSPADSRACLRRIFQLSEASLRDRQEKVNLTHSAFESVRLEFRWGTNIQSVLQVERSIRLIDQEIQEQEHAIALGPGRHLAPIVLPAIVVPKWAKPPLLAMSPEPEEARANEAAAAARNRSKKGKKSKRKESATELDPAGEDVDPNEPLYCYCNKISFGEMIACDDPHCLHEWFHLGCTGLTAAPEGRKKWYCVDCVARKSRKRNR
ncbi:unnamed protein product [Mycena citricolor]|uniref:Zinc finger PHD-type domain-containing protein n=1 Tax=Mycena citricolor TaxID=2018698 RepID=A0AAD2HPU9_9AGAR|nr:unnamed protein product [Mycena citricolor]